MGDCDLCNEETQLIEGTVMKRTSHGGPVMLCDGCWDLLSRARCALCGTTDLPAEAMERTTVSEHADSSRGGYVCDDCRTVLDWNH